MEEEFRKREEEDAVISTMKKSVEWLEEQLKAAKTELFNYQKEVEDRRALVANGYAGEVREGEEQPGVVAERLDEVEGVSVEAADPVVQSEGHEGEEIDPVSTARRSFLAGLDEGETEENAGQGSENSVDADETGENVTCLVGDEGSGEEHGETEEDGEKISEVLVESGGDGAVPRGEEASMEKDVSDPDIIIEEVGGVSDPKEGDSKSSSKGTKKGFTSSADRAKKSSGVGSGGTQSSIPRKRVKPSKIRRERLRAMKLAEMRAERARKAPRHLGTKSKASGSTSVMEAEIQRKEKELKMREQFLAEGWDKMQRGAEWERLEMERRRQDEMEWEMRGSIAELEREQREMALRARQNREAAELGDSLLLAEWERKKFAFLEMKTEKRLREQVEEDGRRQLELMKQEEMEMERARLNSQKRDIEGMIRKTRNEEGRQSNHETIKQKRAELRELKSRATKLVGLKKPGEKPSALKQRKVELSIMRNRARLLDRELKELTTSKGNKNPSKVKHESRRSGPSVSQNSSGVDYRSGSGPSFSANPGVGDAGLGYGGGGSGFGDIGPGFGAGGFGFGDDGPAPAFDGPGFKSGRPGYLEDGPSYGNGGASFGNGGPGFGNSGAGFGNGGAGFGNGGAGFGDGGPGFGNGGPGFGNGGPGFGNGGPGFGNGGPGFGNDGPGYGGGGPGFGNGRPGYGGGGPGVIGGGPGYGGGGSGFGNVGPGYGNSGPGGPGFRNHGNKSSNDRKRYGRGRGR